MALKFRRGTTAQQSGSLAFGEPFVNTTLGTLIVGGDTGDIILASSTGLGLVSGSSQVTLQSTTGFTAYNTALATITGSLITSASADRVSITNINSFTSSINTTIKSKLDTDGVISGSSQVSLKSTSGFSAFDTALATITGSLITSASANTIAVSNLNTFSGSQLTQNTALATITGSLITSASTAKTTNDAQDVSITNLNTFSGSQLTQNSALATITGSLISSASAAKTTNDSQDVSITNLNTFSGSQLTQNTALATITGSLIVSASNLTQRVAANEAVSSSYARTNSANTFNGTQTVSGSLYVTQDLVVQGSSSIQNVSSSTLNIGTNLITVAVNQPSVRFGGIAVIDSGSSGASGSLLYDSVEDEFIFVHRGNGTNVTSSHFVLGPETIDNLGNETYLTNNRLPKGTGKEHLNDSNITDTGTLITLGSNSAVNGTFYATGATLVSGSSQITLQSVTGFSTYDTTLSIITGSLISSASAAKTTNDSQGVSITNLNSTTASLLVETANLEAFSASALTRLSNLEGTDISITLTGDVTGTGTITNLGNVSFATTIGANSVALGTDTTGDYVASLVAGTGVTLSNNSGEGATPTVAIGQSVATNATPTFGNLTINGTITATGDITAFFTSDRRHKNNIQTISNPVLKVKQLNGVTWEWNDDVNEVTKSTPKTGLIAQEVQQVLPQVVTERQDGFLALDYSKMVGLLVEAIKEQQIQIDQLKAQIGSK